MSFPRSSGVLLHPTSLPGRFGIGDLGPSALEFIELIAAAGQRVWQVLPLGPTGYGSSPYQSFSAFAGNPLLISLEGLADEGLLDRNDLPLSGAHSTDAVEFDDVAPQQTRLLERAFGRFQSAASGPQQAELMRFSQEHADWLDDYALFQAIKWAHGGVAWTSWEP